jgi:hypothetical protein
VLAVGIAQIVVSRPRPAPSDRPVPEPLEPGS